MPFYLQLLHSALATELAITLPFILLLLVVGLSTAVLQALFQIEDATFSLLPKTIAMIIAAMFGGLGMLNLVEALFTGWLSHAATIVHQSWS
jgi:flagellar biosynthesis protein FliQ